MRPSKQIIILLTATAFFFIILLYSLSLNLYKSAPPPISSPTPTSTVSPDKPDANEGKFCGGFAGILCPEGYLCQMDASYPDAGGTCTKATGQIPAISQTDLYQGWYWAAQNQKKPNTPTDWIFIDAGRSSCWHRPDVECTFLPDQ